MIGHLYMYDDIIVTHLLILKFSSKRFDNILVQDIQNDMSSFCIGALIKKDLISLTS